MDQNGAGLRSLFGMRNKVRPEQFEEPAKVVEGLNVVDGLKVAEGDEDYEPQDIPEGVLVEGTEMPAPSAEPEELEEGDGEGEDFVPDLKSGTEEKVELNPENKRLKLISGLIGDYKSDDHLEDIHYLRGRDKEKDREYEFYINQAWQALNLEAEIEKIVALCESEFEQYENEAVAVTMETWDGKMGERAKEIYDQVSDEIIEKREERLAAKRNLRNKVEQYFDMNMEIIPHTVRLLVIQKIDHDIHEKCWKSSALELMDIKIRQSHQSTKMADDLYKENEVLKDQFEQDMKDTIEESYSKDKVIDELKDIVDRLTGEQTVLSNKLLILDNTLNKANKECNKSRFHKRSKACKTIRRSYKSNIKAKKGGGKPKTKHKSLKKSTRRKSNRKRLTKKKSTRKRLTKKESSRKKLSRRR